jgi:hypothetical protein
MPLDLFRAAEADGGLVGPCIIEGGPRVVSTPAPPRSSRCDHAPGGMTVRVIYGDEY